MKEYRLKITDVEEFIIISPKVLALLLKKIHGMENHTIEIPVESIMPPGYTQYLLNVINSNRSHKLFNFFSTTEEPLQKEHIYKIIEHQMRNLKIESEECFKKIVLHVGDSEDIAEYEIETMDFFFCLCKNENSRFVYIFPDGNRESIFVEYSDSK